MAHNGIGPGGRYSAIIHDRGWYKLIGQPEWQNGESILREGPIQEHSCVEMEWDGWYGYELADLGAPSVLAALEEVCRQVDVASQ